MPRTLQSLIDEAMARSASARPDTFTSAASELQSRANLAMQEMFFAALPENPHAIAAIADQPFVPGVAPTPGGWARPADAMSVLAIRATSATVATPAIAAGADIAIVPFNDPLVQAGQPSVYELMGRFIAAGQAIDPTGGTLRITYARQPNAFTSGNSPSDPLVPDPYLMYVVADLAYFLASREGRAEDAAAFLSEKQGWQQAWVSWLRNGTQGLVQRFRTLSPPIVSDAG